MHFIQQSPLGSIGIVEDLRTGGRWFEPPTQQMFFSRVDDSHCNRIHSSLSAIHFFDNGYVGK